MPEISFADLLLVVACAAAVPLALGLVPRIPIPGAVLEILAGILVGPAVLGWVHVDVVLDVLATFGVAFLLFLAGMELDFVRLRGAPLRLALAGFTLSLAIGLVVAVPLEVAGVVIDPVLIAVVLSSTSLGIVIPILKDAGQLATRVGAYVVAACSVAELGSIIALSMLFSGRGAPDPLETAAKLAILGVALVLIALLVARHGRFRARVDAVLFRLQDSSAQLRVRIAMLVLLVFVVLSDSLRFDAILGSFMAGALLSALVDPARDEELGHVRHKLEGMGFGFFIPVFFVVTGVRFPVDELLGNSSALLRIPLFVALLLLVRGLPALLLRREVGRAAVVPAALLQATSLSFIVVATRIGVEIGELRPVNAASLVAAGMISVLVFPGAALALLRRNAPRGNVVEKPMEPLPEE